MSKVANFLLYKILRNELKVQILLGKFFLNCEIKHKLFISMLLLYKVRAILTKNREI